MYVLLKIRDIPLSYLVYIGVISCVNLAALLAGNIDGLLFVKTSTTSLLLIFAFSFRDLTLDREYKTIAALLFVVAAYVVLSGGEITLHSKALAYLAFVLWTVYTLLNSVQPPFWIPLLVGAIGFLVGARGVFLAAFIGFMLSTLNSKRLKIFVPIAFFCLYTLLIPGLVIEGATFFDVGKSEIDRSIMNAYVSTGLLSGYLAPQPTLIESSNVLEYADGDGIFVHNYWLVIAAYTGPLIFFLPSRLANHRKSLNNNGDAGAWAILILLAISPESHIARFLIFALPGLLPLPALPHKQPFKLNASQGRSNA